MKTLNRDDESILQTITDSLKSQKAKSYPTKKTKLFKRLNVLY
jgi:hypothetical protein